MFQINYSFSNYNSLDTTRIDDVSLRYNLFLGSLVLKEENNSISMNWNWIPLIDFASCVFVIYNNLIVKNNAKEKFEFTESEAEIIFSRNENIIKITTSFSNDVLEISLADFQYAVTKFYKNVVFDILEINPTLRDNAVFCRYMNEADKM